MQENQDKKLKLAEKKEVKLWLHKHRMTGKMKELWSMKFTQNFLKT